MACSNVESVFHTFTWMELLAFDGCGFNVGLEGSGVAISDSDREIVTCDAFRAAVAAAGSAYVIHSDCSRSFVK